MFGWPMEEEAKLEFSITVNWRREDGSIATTQLGTLDRGACRSAEATFFPLPLLWRQANCASCLARRLVSAGFDV
jgi:hypothetical protein